MLIGLDHPVLLLDLLVQGLPQVLDRRRDLHLLLAQRGFVPVLQLQLQALYGCLRLPQFLQYFAVLCFEPDQFLLDAAGHLEPLIFLFLEFGFDPLEFALVLFLHLPEGVDKFLDDLEGLLDGAVLLHVVS